MFDSAYAAELIAILTFHSRPVPVLTISLVKHCLGKKLMLSADVIVSSAAIAAVNGGVSFLTVRYLTKWVEARDRKKNGVKKR